MNLSAIVNEMRLLIKQDNPSEKDKREVIMNYILFCTTVYVPEMHTAKISDPVTFETNYQTAKRYFLSFIN